MNSILRQLAIVLSIGVPIMVILILFLVNAQPHTAQLYFNYCVAVLAITSFSMSLLTFSKTAK